MLKVGDSIPDFQLKNQDDEIVDIGNYADKYVCIYFYPKANTPGCTAQSCQFRDYNAQLNKLNCEVLGISADKVSAQAKFQHNYNFQFDLLSDEDHKVAELFGTWVEKSMYGRKYWGVQRSTFLVAPGGKILAVWEKANPLTNAKEVFEYLQKH